MACLREIKEDVPKMISKGFEEGGYTFFLAVKLLPVPLNLCKHSICECYMFLSFSLHVAA